MLFKIFAASVETIPNIVTEICSETLVNWPIPSPIAAKKPLIDNALTRMNNAIRKGIIGYGNVEKIFLSLDGPSRCQFLISTMIL